MSLSRRILKAEQAAENLELWQRRCSSCRGPIPSICSSILLGPGGVYRVGSVCSVCSWEGGGGQLGIDPRTGEPNGSSKLLLLGMGFEAWLGLHGTKRFGGAVDLTLQYHRSPLAEWAAGLDLSTPPTQAEITEAEAATRIFPRWGDPDLELARLGLGKG